MAIDRDATLKKAEKLLRQGRLEPAIAEYLSVVEEFPRDWSTANTLGELYARAGHPQQAVGQYARIAQHFVDEGFYPEGGRALQEDPQAPAAGRDDADSARRHLRAAGLARRCQVASERHRRAAPREGRSPRRGRNRRAARDDRPDGLRGQAHRRPHPRGDGRGGGGRQALQGASRRPLEKGRTAEAIDALKEFVRINPLEREARSTLAKAALEQGDLAGAREFLDEDSAGEDPALLLPLAEIELRSGELARAKVLLGRLLDADPSRRGAVAELGWSFVGVESGGDVPVHRCGRRRRRRHGGVSGGRDEPAGVRRARAGADSRAAQARRGLRRRWPRADDVRGAGTADRRLSGRQPGRRSPRHRRGSRRA